MIHHLLIDPRSSPPANRRARPISARAPGVLEELAAAGVTFAAEHPDAPRFVR